MDYIKIIKENSHSGLYLACCLTRFLQEVILQASVSSPEFFPCQTELRCCECRSQPPLANTEASPALVLLSLLHLSEIQTTSIIYGRSWVILVRFGLVLELPRLIIVTIIKKDRGCTPSFELDLRPLIGALWMYSLHPQHPHQRCLITPTFEVIKGWDGASEGKDQWEYKQLLDEPLGLV